MDIHSLQLVNASIFPNERCLKQSFLCYSKHNCKGNLKERPPSLWPHPGRAVTCLLHWFPTPCPGAWLHSPQGSWLSSVSSWGRGEHFVLAASNWLVGPASWSSMHSLGPVFLLSIHSFCYFIMLLLSLCFLKCKWFYCPFLRFYF